MGGALAGPLPRGTRCEEPGTWKCRPSTTPPPAGARCSRWPGWLHRTSASRASEAELQESQVSTGAGLRSGPAPARICSPPAPAPCHMLVSGCPGPAPNGRRTALVLGVPKVPPREPRCSILQAGPTPLSVPPSASPCTGETVSAPVPARASSASALLGARSVTGADGNEPNTQPWREAEQPPPSQVTQDVSSSPEGPRALQLVGLSTWWHLFRLRVLHLQKRFQEES